MISEFTFTFIVKPTKLKQYEFEEQLYNKFEFLIGGTKFEISVVIMQFSETKNFVPFPNIQQLSKTTMQEEL